MDPDCFAEVKNGWEPLVGTGTEQLDPILSPLGPHTRSQGSYLVILGPTTAFVRTYHDLVDPDGFAEVKNGWESLVGTGTEQFDPILSPIIFFWPVCLIDINLKSQGIFFFIELCQIHF